MLTLSIPNMSCGHCSSAVTKAIRALDPQAQVQFDMPSRTASVESSADKEQLLRSLDAAGYRATVA